MIRLDIQFTIRKPGPLHPARWMAKAIYSLKMELLFNGNEARMALTAREFPSFFGTAKIEDSSSLYQLKISPKCHPIKKAATFAKNLVCVNDVAEHAIALIKDFICAAKNEEQKQFLLQVVEMHRKNFKQCNRQTLLEM
ncbi:hypothetical protein AVEN_270146-1 [Araneus ventricosus]|uniref:Uncharacterized protein n=1 Tax=Araneus ventricosus TaxID=182803 RepID=A0A4Y2PHE1_ARAVE|nr:hypothetical protein AVEN_267004-1 [Araneus ventricosus]GBN49506.1 hypothetical protein AVEN_270146-1 [Araneus ventricosus]